MVLQHRDTPDYGDFVDSDDEWEVEDDAEALERYDDGMLYPICIGEVLAQTYCIEHKLGHGGFSTVWMAHDLKRRTDVALKITVPGKEGEHEHNMQREIIRNVHVTSNLVISQEVFTLPGPRGNHTVLVFPLRGPSLAHYKTQRPLVARMAVRMSAAGQLLQALAHLHKGGIVHRDLNSGSVMWGLTPLDNYSTAIKYQYLGRPQKIALSDDIWKQGELVKALVPPQNLLTDNVYLGDFGLSIKAGTAVSVKYQAPGRYCALERFHNVDLSPASDMWSYMCIFAELYLGCVPIRGNAPVSAIESIVETLGPLPENWKGCLGIPGATSEDSWYHPTVKQIGDSLEEKLGRARPEVSAAERHHVLSIMSKGFYYLPQHRLTAAQLLQDTSFQALMRLYGA